MEMGMDEGEGRTSVPYTAARRSSSARCEADVKRAARVRASGARRVTETRGRPAPAAAEVMSMSPPAAVVCRRVGESAGRDEGERDGLVRRRGDVSNSTGLD